MRRAPTLAGRRIQEYYRERWSQLHQYDTATTKERAKLTRDLLQFLPEIGVPPSLYNVLPRDVIQFLMQRDRSGLTTVHHRSCPFWSSVFTGASRRCGCPRRQNATSTSVIRGTLQGMFRDAGLTDRWQPATLSGNPVKSAEVEQFIRLNNREQLAAGVQRRRAPLIALDVYTHLVDTALQRWKNARAGAGAAGHALLEVASRARDVLFLVLLWHTGLRATDLLRVLVQQLDTAPTQGHIWRLVVTVTKTSEDPRDTRRIALVDDGSYYCVQTAYRLYVRSLERLGLRLPAGHLFRSVRRVPGSRLKCVWGAPLSWAAANYRWAALRRAARLCSRISMHSPHGSRPRWEKDRGTPVDEICSLIDWTRATLDYYTADRDVMSLPEALALFSPTETAGGRRVDARQ